MIFTRRKVVRIYISLILFYFGYLLVITFNTSTSPSPSNGFIDLGVVSSDENEFKFINNQNYYETIKNNGILIEFNS
jgi:hypothetical protein